MDLCNPAIFYLVVSLFLTVVLFASKYSTFYLFLFNLAFTFFITYLINYVCKKYTPMYAWYAIIAVVMLTFIMNVLKGSSNIM